MLNLNVPVPESNEQVKLFAFAYRLALILIVDSEYVSVKKLFVPSVENVKDPNLFAELLLIS